MIRALFVLLSCFPLIASEENKNGFLRPHEQARELKKEDGGSSFDGLDERHQCVSFDSAEIQGKAKLEFSDPECATNSCGGGCCRAFHYLVCDTSNLHPTIPCVCNENTKGNEDRVGDGGTVIVVPDIGVPGPGSQTAPATTPGVVIVVPGAPTTPQVANPGQPTYALPPSYVQGTDRTDSNGAGVGTSSGKGKGKGGGGGGGGGSNPSDRNQTPNANGLIETGACEPFDSVADTKALSTYSDSTCRTNSCAGGCCRSYHWLLCDETNAFPTIPCVCNENTANGAVIPLAPSPPPNQLAPSTPTSDRDGTPGLPTYVLPPSIQQGPDSTPEVSNGNGDKGKSGKTGKNKGGNNDGNNGADRDQGGNGSGLYEIHPCIEMDSYNGNPFDARGDSECQTNSCGGGCCRAYNWLLCDTDNSLSTIACICNGNTRDRSSWNTIPDIPDEGSDNDNDEDRTDDGATPGGVDVSIEPTTAPPSSAPGPQTICSNGSWFWNNPAFSTFTECSSDGDCAEKQCCLSRFCLCGKPVRGEEELVCLPNVI